MRIKKNLNKDYLVMLDPMEIWRKLPSKRTVIIYK